MSRGVNLKTIGLLILFCSYLSINGSEENAEFKPIIKLTGDLEESCSTVYVFVPNKLDSLELESIWYIIELDGELVLKSTFIDAANLGELSKEGYSLSSICTTKSDISKIKVRAAYTPPVGDNGELSFCIKTKEFLLSRLL